MKFDIILHLRKKAEKDINRAMRAAESGNDLEAAKLFIQAGGTLVTLGRGLEIEINEENNQFFTH
ncbi:hypothetical protein CDW99_005028 [Salmonella enterica subsp. enterica serovar Ealing]|uniref:Uncharacterized protein n=1 Tax=Salmonella enterica I TaxID=59201 RepID=A0A403QH35_SALET|nr:hypothetical protein [Salmonella enterica]EAS0615004.1 hypothetical protein [Salmonella enterica subsp. enterica serovar Dahomey]EBQ9005356.1 hypothetical protein [Salmonella enterica subsp. enterica serovar Blockley]EBY7079440.1 hypothetical protein [Salmonella enterica subsp. enterica serovar Ealing]ECD6162194.1 hypothetical protein [Salmonella enterica subsp. enterica]ECU7995463.1 hypothetical protein [Salmonella enterica subsp. enterica serovar Toucra]EDT7530681.1 hypothetical protein 